MLKFEIDTILTNPARLVRGEYSNLVWLDRVHYTLTATGIQYKQEETSSQGWQKSGFFEKAQPTGIFFLFYFRISCFFSEKNPHIWVLFVGFFNTCQLYCWKK